MAKWEQERRLDYIDDRFALGMTVNRSDIMTQFSVSVAQASLDIQHYLSLMKSRYRQRAIMYDGSAKAYTPTRYFESQRKSSTERLHAWKAFGINLNTESGDNGREFQN
jgi:hypothetical protein